MLVPIVQCVADRLFCLFVYLVCVDVYLARRHLFSLIEFWFCLRLVGSFHVYGTRYDRIQRRILRKLGPSSKLILDLRSFCMAVTTAVL